MRTPAGASLLLLLALLATPSAAEPISYSGGRGRPITLVVRDAPLAEVFEMLARKERVNVLLGNDVEGSISVNLFEVSLDQAVRSVAEAAGFVAERRRGSYVIVEREEAGRDSAETNTMIRSFKIEYTEPSQVLPIVEKHLSRYGEVTELPGRRLLVVQDLPEFLVRIEQLLAEVDREPHQILIEAKILEITLDESQTLGVDWTSTLDVDDGLSIGARDFATGTAGFFFDLMASDYEVHITALAEKGRVRTLSTPRLLATEHEEAEVVIGDRLGFRVTTTINQITTESVEFLESGVILRVTASVDRRGRVVLEIHPEVSTGVISDGLPAQTTTEVTTKFVTRSGQPVFIAGLLKDRETDSREGIPYLSDIPLLGRIFSHTETIDVNTETVVILTAHLLDDGMEQVSGPLTDLSPDEEQLEENRLGREEHFGPRGAGPKGDPLLP